MTVPQSGAKAEALRRNLERIEMPRSRRRAQASTCTAMEVRPTRSVLQWLL